MTPHYATNPHPEELADRYLAVRGYDEAPQWASIPRRHPLDRALDPRRIGSAMAADEADFCPPEESAEIARKIVTYCGVALIVPAVLFWGIPLIFAAIQWGGRLLGGLW